MAVIEVTLPWPPKELSPNARLHWAKVMKFKKAYREACYYLTLAEIDRTKKFGDGPLLVDLEFRKPSRRAMDWDNLIARMKAGLDGVSDALKINDRQFRLSMRVADEIGGFVKVRITQGEENGSQI